MSAAKKALKAAEKVTKKRPDPSALDAIARGMAAMRVKAYGEAKAAFESAEAICATTTVRAEGRAKAKEGGEGGDGEGEGEGERGGDAGRAGRDAFTETGERRARDGETKGKFTAGGEELRDKLSGGDGGSLGGDGWEVANAISARAERVFAHRTREGDVL